MSLANAVLTNARGDELTLMVRPSSPGAELERLLAYLEWQLVAVNSLQLDARTSTAVRATRAAFHYVVSGEIDIIGTAEPVRLRAGDLVLLSGAAAHRIHAVEDTRMHTVELDLVMSGGLFTGSVLPEILVACEFVAREPEVAALIQRVSAEFAERAGSAVTTQRLVTMIASMAVRSWIESGCAPQVWLESLRDPQVAAAITAMRADLGRAWTVEALARVTHASRSAFAKRFSDVVGEGPARYLATLRMDQAKQLLTGDRASVSIIAQRLGYGSDAAFSRAFRRYAGMSPAMWRRDSRRPRALALSAVARG